MSRRWTYQLGLAAASEWGMETEFRESFDGFKLAGESESEATWRALYEWDLLPADDVYDWLVALGDRR